MAINNTIYPSQIHLAWRAHWQWIGLKRYKYYSGTYWYWIGKETTLLSNSLWEDGRPWLPEYGGGDCGCMYISLADRLLDCNCTAYRCMSLCERDAE